MNIICFCVKQLQNKEWKQKHKDAMNIPFFISLEYMCVFVFLFFNLLLRIELQMSLLKFLFDKIDINIFIFMH